MKSDVNNLTERSYLGFQPPLYSTEGSKGRDIVLVKSLILRVSGIEEG